MAKIRNQHLLGLAADKVKKVFDSSRVNLPNQVERLYQPFYDYIEVDTTAITPSTKFFQVPQGQNGKSIIDTNMELAGNLPKGQAFLVTGISVEVLPNEGLSVTGDSEFGDIMYSILRSGALVFTVGSKDYVVQGNLMKFPPKNLLQRDTAASGYASAFVMDYAQADGEFFSIVPILLESSQNFSVTLKDIAATQASNDVRIGVHLEGILYRNAQ
jgi:hypothetical protein